MVPDFHSSTLPFSTITRKVLQYVSLQRPQCSHPPTSPPSPLLHILHPRKAHLDPIRLYTGKKIVLFAQTSTGSLSKIPPPFFSPQIAVIHPPLTHVSYRNRTHDITVPSTALMSRKRREPRIKKIPTPYPAHP